MSRSVIGCYIDSKTKISKQYMWKYIKHIKTTSKIKIYLYFIHVVCVYRIFYIFVCVHKIHKQLRINIYTKWKKQ